MLKEKVIPIIWLFMAALIIGASIGFSARASADPGDVEFLIGKHGYEICGWFDQNGVSGPTLRTLGINVMDKYPSITPEEAAEVVYESIDNFCPEFMPAIRRAVKSELN